ncbi:MAG: hypothetical protein HY019_06095 [Aquabacterium sp.]|uniref:hypothetical protein n=1 Tax=Aquabacterium sp. TaxID=1872578 RepID=UPI0025BDBB50|nr:hypothetical protein [Aquabacterium sp.]MBI3381561.1 hypothetical protein [Aquabacterium sp.]
MKTVSPVYKTTLHIGTLALLLVLSACATRTQTRVTSAATTPLSDLNLVRDEIPEVLQNALKQPYQPPTDATCPVVVTEVHQLDAVLGADLDAPASDDTPSLLDRGEDMAENTAIGAIQRTAEGLVPFRSWVRKLSGAERHSRKLAAAITAGSIRRAFLKGFAVSHGCVLTPPPQLAAASAGAAANASPAPASPTAPAADGKAVAPAAPPLPPASAP